jgi:hypothetical protein
VSGRVAEQTTQGIPKRHVLVFLFDLYIIFPLKQGNLWRIVLSVRNRSLRQGSLPVHLTSAGLW